MLLHWQHSPDWVDDDRPGRTACLRRRIEEADPGARRVGARAACAAPDARATSGWKMAMIRMNHNGTRMDGPTYADNTIRRAWTRWWSHVKQVKKEGMGVISMKLVGDGTFTRAKTARRR
jgi:hypothetical protein